MTVRLRILNVVLRCASASASKERRTRSKGVPPSGYSDLPENDPGRRDGTL